MATTDNLRLAAINRHRKRLFGDSSLTAYTTTPEAGEASAAVFTVDWFGQRIEPITDGNAKDAGAWQFQVKAASDWEASQAFMLLIVALTVGMRRWKVTKVEKPVGVSLVWKVRAEIQ